VSDDGRFALVEFVAQDPAAFTPILADRSVRCFVKGQANKADIEAHVKKIKKNFDLEHFGVVMP